jgi:enoyl-CoA hydratase
MTDTVKLEFDGAIARLTLARAEKLNALTFAMMEAIEEACGQIERSRTTRAVIISSDNPKAFCAGADIAEWGALEAQEMWGVWTRVGHRVFSRLAALPQPTIAAIHGMAFGGGLELALACDLRLATSDSRFAMPEAKVGAIPGWGGTQRLTRLIGTGRAKSIILRAAPIDAATACNWGLIEEVVEVADLQRRATEIATEISSLAPGAVRIAKQLIDAGHGGMSAETLAAGLAFSLSDGREGVSAFKEKRTPKFSDS